MNFDDLLRQEIVSEVSELKNIELGTEAYKTTVDGVTKLMDRAIEIEKLNVETDQKYESLENERSIKRQEIEEDKKDRKLKNYISIAGLVLPLAITVWGTVKTLKFEENGTVTTIVGRGFVNKLLPKK